MKQEEEFLIFMQTVHPKTLLNGFLYFGCGFLLSRSCQANLRVEEPENTCSRVACQSGGWRRCGWRRLGEEGSHSFFLCFSLFVSRPCREEAVRAALVIRAGLSWAVLRISAGLWGGTVSEGGGGGEQMRDNDPGCFTVKRQSYKFIYLLSADPPAQRCLAVGSWNSPSMHQPVTILRKTQRRKNDYQMLYCLCNFHIISREEKSLLGFNHAE